MAAITRTRPVRWIFAGRGRSAARGRQAGAELIEFAFVLPLLLFVIVGIVDFGFMFQRYEVITNAAREGARVGVLPGYGAVDAQTRALDYLQAAGLDRTLGTAVAAPRDIDFADGTTGRGIEVTVTYPHGSRILTPISMLFGPGIGSITLRAVAVMRSEVQGGD